MQSCYQYQPNNSVNVGFPDIANHWGRNYITLIAQNGVFAGYDDGTFGPDRTMTRAEATQAIGKAENRSMQPLSSARFTDVPENKWYYNRIMNSSIPKP